MDSEIIKIITCCVGGPIVCGLTFLVAANWKKIMNLHKQKYSFSEAIEAFRNGSTIYRPEKYTKYLTRVTILRGVETSELGSCWDKNDFKEGCSFNLEDVLANDWIIEKVEKK